MFCCGGKLVVAGLGSLSDVSVREAHSCVLISIFWTMHRLCCKKNLAIQHRTCSIAWWNHMLVLRVVIVSLPIHKTARVSPFQGHEARQPQPISTNIHISQEKQRHQGKYIPILSKPSTPFGLVLENALSCDIHAISSRPMLCPPPPLPLPAFSLQT